MTNVDPAEISKFESIASRWWDPSGEFKPLHEINPLRCNYIDEKANIAGKKVLDIGCGGGIASEGLAQRGATVTGIDLGEAPLEVAKLHALESGLNIDYQCVAAEALAEEQAGTFDVVTCLEMLEHVPDPASIITACATLLKPGGQLFLSTINRNPKAYGAMILAAEYVLKMVPKGTHEYRRFIKPSELARWVREDDLLVEELMGMTYNPLTRQFKLTPNDVDVNYLLYATKPE
ncbi:bifunctional 2-polyprenyl-6-hydroxyphenol methylase/3-demethylubiquinol 3-O-methyltransferase UbiG [Marinibactrum halimedae]|uniref:Ubiquinone biosynthesis O-methyltransferase n=1 Tax=Marinibactrum halimedae TaxID=1444977 RepID=A0AA37WN67_9GAMM|nr:bifunctional 2-polyprenyl-6-hydroxyphenol methylase/3-demethylubiquinol 3-O-methyltransferase UbiG [Marinibactrum halimedae]MCD9459817.1 bifunctional 2-polyprenyl-6-hydroxyphenol methylase/3-demethylubiquinol 3-O-methyltransferase UbiG [Marinibactrum halimedae]GLS26990.1 ubiquinone biosynthesis O-methyltransferase [Marinibactrum halimedae]